MMTGSSDDRARLAQPPQRLEAAHAGHHHVEQHGVDAVRADHLERVRRRSRRSAPCSRCAPAGATARPGSSRRRRRAAAWRSVCSMVPVSGRARRSSRSILSSRPAKSIGLVSKSSQPASSAFWRSPTMACAVSAMIGIAAWSPRRPSGAARTPSRRSPAGRGPCRIRSGLRARAPSPDPAGRPRRCRTSIAAARQPPRQHVAIHLVVLDDQDHGIPAGTPTVASARAADGHRAGERGWRHVRRADAISARWSTRAGGAGVQASRGACADCPQQPQTANAAATRPMSDRHDAGMPARAMADRLGVLGALWLGGVVAGLAALARVRQQPGRRRPSAPARWPAGSRLALDSTPADAGDAGAPALHLHARQHRRAGGAAGAGADDVRGPTSCSSSPAASARRLGADRPVAARQRGSPASRSSATTTASRRSASAPRRPARRSSTRRTASCCSAAAPPARAGTPATTPDGPPSSRCSTASAPIRATLSGLRLFALRRRPIAHRSGAVETAMRSTRN